MSNMVIPIVVLVFAFGAFGTYINSTGLYKYQAPESGASMMNTTSLSDMNQGLLATAQNPWYAPMLQLSILANSVIGGVIAIFTLGPLLTSYGIPLGLAGVFISPAAIILAMWMFQMWLGRDPE
jgi:hypothetical protein